MDDAPFLAAILAHPELAQPREVYRDWLQEEPSRGWLWDHLHRLVLDRPESDQLRLLCADWLEENGQAERAEFCRIQCELAKVGAAGETCWASNGAHCGCYTCTLRRRERELLARRHNEWLPLGNWCVANGRESERFAYTGGLAEFRRGFVEAVTVPTLAVLLDGPCENCTGDEPQLDERGQCPVCRGTGRTEGIAAQLFAAAPVTKVTVAELEPYTGVSYPGDIASWYDGDRSDGGFHPQSDLPQPLWKLLAGYFRSDDRGKWYDTNALALAALSDAVVDYGRSQAAGITHEAPCLACWGGVDDSFNSRGDDCSRCRGTGTIRRLGLPPLSVKKLAK